MWIGIGVAVAIGSMYAQTLSPEFEVASVKHNMSGATGDQIRLTPGGRFEIRNASLLTLIQNAYHGGSIRSASTS